MDKQKGAILILFAAISLLLIGFAALVVDTGINESTRAEVQQASQNAALGALSAYLGHLKTPQPTPNYMAASQVARQAAMRILDNNTYIGQAFRKNPEASSFNLGGGTTFSGDNGSIEFGLYYWLKPANSDPCNAKYPCFNATGTASQANAVKIRSSLGANPLRAIFSRVLGQQYFNIETSSIATLIPQNYAFLLDLSTSVTGKNHPVVGEKYCYTGLDDKDHCAEDIHADCVSEETWSRYPKCWRTGSASQFVYELEGSGDPSYVPPAGCSPGGMATACSCLYVDDPAEGVEPGYCVEDFNSYWAGKTYRETLRGDSLDRSRYQGQPWNTGNPGTTIAPDPELVTRYGWSASDPRIHYRNDYHMFSLDFGRDLAVPASEPGAAEHTVRTLAMDFGNPSASSDFYPSYSAGRGPEPLFSLFSAAHEAMQFIVDRAVAADQFLFAGFDTSILRKRVTCSNGTASENCDSKFVKIGDSTFTQLKDALNITVPSQRTTVNASHFLNLGLFPLMRNTDGQMILWDTYDEMSRLENFSQAKNLVFLFTDGLMNCGLPSHWSESVGFPSQYLANRQCSGIEIGKDGEEVVIGRGPKVLKTLQQIAGETLRAPQDKSLVQIFKEKKIAVSVILLGQGIGGHNLVRKSRIYPNKCMDLAEAINQGEEWVDWGKRDYICTPESESKFCDSSTGYVNQYKLNEDYRLMEQGAQNFYLPNYLYSAIVAPTKGAWIPIMQPLDPDGNGSYVDFESQLNTACANLPNGGDALQNFQIAAGHTTVTDDSGRLLYHPKGWSVTEQIQREIERVLAGGYMLVEPPRG